MEKIYFEFEGKTYSGYLLSSVSADAKYFWFVFNEDEMVQLFGDTIAFHIHNGELLPVYQYIHKASFIEYLRQKVKAVLFQGQSSEE